MNSFENNQVAWLNHYQKSKAKLLYPDENVVRYIEHYFKEYPDKFKNAVALDLGCGSGRHLQILREKTSITIGQDFAENILQDLEQPVVCATAQKLPYPDHHFDFILAWGVLHYLKKEDVTIAIQEIYRVLKKDGVFFGTIRSDKDTHLKEVLEKGDLQSAASNLYSEDEVIKKFEIFNSIKMGFISRVPLGENKLIAHHIFEVKK